MNKFSRFVAACAAVACEFGAMTAFAVTFEGKPSRPLAYLVNSSRAGVASGVRIQNGQTVEMKVCAYNGTAITTADFFGNSSGGITVANADGETVLTVNGVATKAKLNWANGPVVLKLETSASGVTLSANGEAVLAADTPIAETTAAWRFMGFNNANGSSYRVYYARVKDADGNLLWDMNPCISRGQVAMHDAVSGRSDALVNWAVGPGTTGWTTLDYIQRKNGGVIDTGVRARSGTKVEATVTIDNTGGDYSVVGSRVNDKRFLLVHVYSGKFWCGYGGTSTGSSLSVKAGTTYTVVSDYKVGSQTITVDGNVVYSGTSSAEVDTGLNVTFFGSNIAWGAPAGTRIERVKIWQGEKDGSNSKLVRDYIPVWQDGYVGFVDLQSGADISLGYDYTWPNPIPADAQPDALLRYVEAYDSRVDTGVVACDGLTAEMELVLSSNPSEDVLPVLTIGTAKDFECLTFYRRKPRLSYKQASVTASQSFRYGERQKVVCEMFSGAQRVKVNGEVVATLSGSGISTKETLKVFGNSQYTSMVRLYGLKIWKGAADGSNPVLVRDFQPALYGGRSALYDHVEKKLHFDTSTTRGKLVAGPRLGVLPKFHEYLEATGSQHVDSGVVGKSPLALQADAQWMELPGETHLLGARTGNTRLHFGMDSSSGWAVGYGAYWYQSCSTRLARMKADAVFSNGAQTLSVDGKQVWKNTVAGEIDTASSLYIFARNVDGTPSEFARVRCYSLDIQQNGEPVRAFRPCRLDGHSGFWDEVTSEFYPSGSFPFTRTAELATGPRKPIGLMLLLR